MGSLASGFGQPLHPMAVTSLPTSLRRRSGRVPAAPGSPISPLRCCRSPATSRLPGRGRCRLTTRSSPIRMTKTFPSCRYPLRRLTRMAAPFGRVGSVESPLTRMIRHTAGCRSRFRSHWYGSLMCPVIFSPPATVFQAFPGRGGPAPALLVPSRARPGVGLGLEGAGRPAGNMDDVAGFSGGLGPGPGPDQFLGGSSFAPNRATSGGDSLSFWSRSASSSLAGRENLLALSGDVRTTMFGADYAKGRMVTGVSLSHSRDWAATPASTPAKSRRPSRGSTRGSASRCPSGSPSGRWRATGPVA